MRRAILKRSYYMIYFVVERDRSLVVAVLDGRRSPEEIRSVIEGVEQAARANAYIRHVSCGRNEKWTDQSELPSVLLHESRRL